MADICRYDEYLQLVNVKADLETCKTSVVDDGGNSQHKGGKVDYKEVDDTPLGVIEMCGRIIQLFYYFL